MSETERRLTQSSPIPTKITSSSTTEETRLLETTATNYNSHNSQTVIEITEQLPSKQSSTNMVTPSSQPTVATDQLIEKIQDILVFSEIKKNLNHKSVVPKRNITKDEADSSSSDSGSESDTDSGDSHHLLKRKFSEWSIDHKPKFIKHLRKRDFAIDALKFATDKWKERHGWLPNQNEALLHNSDTKVTVTTTQNTDQAMNNTTVDEGQKTKEYQHLPSSAESIFGIAKNASVCAILALLHERRQSSSLSTETDVFFQSLALTTLSLGVKAKSTSTEQMVLKEILVYKWLGGRSALEWAVENNSQLVLSDKRVQLVIEALWRSGPDWHQDPNHPARIWSNRIDHQPRNFVWMVISNTFSDFFARCASPRYQAIIALVSTMIYTSFHLATLSNLDYTSDTPFAFEYVYYVFMFSDLLLELIKFMTNPIVYLKKLSSYLSFITVGLLTSSAIIRFFALLVVEDVQKAYSLLSVSFDLLVLATPMMFLRIFASSSANDLYWAVAKTNYIVAQCIVNSLWVFRLSLLVILGFWVALSALQYEDVNPLSMLRFLVLGALHAPEIADILYYHPQIAGILLVFYLFATIIVLGSLLTASFLTTLLDIYKRKESIKNEWVIKRCLGVKPALNMLIPGVLVDVVFRLLQWISHVVFRRERSEWIEKVRQVTWYTVYSPIILVIGIIELLNALMFNWSVVSKTFSTRSA
ncbi:hypothetical protein G6F55_010266 [Rhizopus delemar]|uniref:Ion transport domain-containing protein n=2 Tax=Rhizopus TaxID=4842 RepID=A0A9P7CV79_9FUNG|nr:hypothetical protein G6F55_010266 [Rhizopus delemar]KAG1540728.1 hypothetical protein G6F51_008346 [Rhizopus arrhizus]KAG1523125.1 hypothetical protein G6F52_005276 [Rhizopus delemar]KAG1550977.1 hypothetical protein G6F49_009125 [Rhizopus delemar]KAG1576055.1 hypothetical protein G6F50_000551 [Rhizopus delemar]